MADNNQIDSTGIATSFLARALDHMPSFMWGFLGSVLGITLSLVIISNMTVVGKMAEGWSDAKVRQMTAAADRTVAASFEAETAAKSLTARLGSLEAGLVDTNGRVAAVERRVYVLEKEHRR